MSVLKQIIVIRKDLNMRKGKMVAQGAHASIKAILSACDETFSSDMGHTIRPQRLITEWLHGLQKKICVSVASEKELLELYNLVKDTTDIPVALITDAGLTEFKEPTHTAVAIGPDYPENIDPLTKHLPLL